MSRSPAVVVIAALLAALLAGGCRTVRPHERETLAKRSMTADQDAGEARFESHQTGAREGAEGGTGHPGGGCGCN